MKQTRRVVSSLGAAAIAASSLLSPASSFAHSGSDAGLHHGIVYAMLASLSRLFEGREGLLTLAGIGIWAALMLGCIAIVRRRSGKASLISPQASHRSQASLPKAAP